MTVHDLHPVYKHAWICRGRYRHRLYVLRTYEESANPTVSDREKSASSLGGRAMSVSGIEFVYCCVRASLALREVTKALWLTAGRASPSP